MKIRAIDSHTGGEPTRLVVEGFPDLGSGPIAERLRLFRREYDQLRMAIVCEPRGHDAIVGALLCEPVDKSSTAAVIFFNNVGYLGMCGHGTIGLIKTLEYLGKISVGSHRIETPVGIVDAELNADGSVAITNVPSYRFAKDVAIEVPGYGKIVGDIAYGGNWFFIISEHSLEVGFANLKKLTDYTVAVRNALKTNAVTGENGVEVEHIELLAPTPNADSRNFVLCPGFEYDRSPCGTGTSAKLACLYEDGKLKEGEVWKQESVVGSVFEGRVRVVGGEIVPTIRATAHVTADVTLVFDEKDPFQFGIRR